MSMLVFKPTTRRIALVTTATLFFLIFGLPLLLLLLAAFTRQWNGVLPSSLTLHHARALAAGDQGAALLHSVATGVAASFIALLFGGGGALVVRGCPPSLRRGLDMLYFLPVALPSSTIGLAMLIAFSRKPFLLNGTVLLVILAHVVLVMAYAYATISAGLDRLPHSLEEIAGSLGASPPRVLLTITLPLLLPQILAALSLGFALSMGELGASIMLYPPQWVTAPVEVFALTDRGDIYAGAALGAALLACAFFVLTLLNRRTSWHGEFQP
ncbi:iron ABC transporter permease [Acidiphilium sp. C61]|jgi:2-aminoethylphosphonate transport system permease protein|uniref:ABC transporter permease n=1 Tax=Acidiphilium sp. C61 TaxID=1671485 RepID=UPI001917CEC6|nr:ABC transporter permease subunit [Acidiphilium sp. C61]